jgi:opacity protein-like surface antigen
MKRIVVAAVAVCLAAAPAFAASPKVDAAIKTFKAVSADPAKLKDNGSSRNTSGTCENSLKHSASFSTKGRLSPATEVRSGDNEQELRDADKSSPFCPQLRRLT